MLIALVTIGGLVFARLFAGELALDEPRDACAVAADLLAEVRPEMGIRSPRDWMPARTLPGYRIEREGALSLEMVVASRVNPDESRVELTRDAFIDGYEQEWEGPAHGVGFTAQRFATTEGAQAFHAFANRFACQFANEAFSGPRGSIGLQIRYRSGEIGEQVSWVSSDTRILVGFLLDQAPPNHAEIEAFAVVVPNP